MSEATFLEQRYRRVLRLLPAAYRRAWEHDMVTALLDTRGVDGSGSDDDALAGLGTPGLGEVVSVVWLAVRARVGVFGATPRQELWGGAVRRVALVGLLLNAAFVLANVVIDVLVMGMPPFGLAFITSGMPGQQPEQILRIGAVLWPAAFAALLIGRRAGAGVLALAALTVETIRVVVFLRDFGEQAPFSVTVLVGQAVPVLALIAFHERAPRLRVRPWLTALVAATTVVVIVYAPFSLSWSDGEASAQPRWFLLMVPDRVGLCVLAVSVAAAIHLGGRRRGHRFGEPGWTLALALLAAVVTGQRVLTLLGYMQVSENPAVRDLALASLVQALLATAAFVVLGVLARSDLPASASVSPAQWPRTRRPTPQ